MLWIAVCDDAVRECSKTAGMIREILEERKVPCTIRQFYSGQELLRSSESFDMIFLDIIMEGLDGMRTAQIIRQKAYGKLLIFLSASREYVFDAYDVEAFQYLLKPIDKKKLKRVLQRAVSKTEEKSQAFMVVSRDRQRKKLLLDDIFYFEIRGRVIEAHGAGGVFSFYEQIGRLERELLGKGFFRCHKSYLVNFKYVDGYNRQELILDNGERIAIAKRRYEAFCGEFLTYMRKKGGIVPCSLADERKQ
ncbi:MAG: LytTR family DNA-binding domain-containing protein [Bacteroidales bacterium]|nr:LytTR family DNA-binding domain-containing protein [Bacteroidales bacterium]MCM1416771.1 LytTR family DNA-binding domain-containing protein [bacterium]MCM1424731.1 LytTR family DNA-binding domain-containing protein [bacterium]